MGELLLVANVAKHAEGTSADELKARCPDLFVHPSVTAAFADMPSLVPEGVMRPPIPVPTISKPLGGEDLYVTPEKFVAYCDCGQRFLQSLAAHFETTLLLTTRSQRLLEISAIFFGTSRDGAIRWLRSTDGATSAFGHFRDREPFRNRSCYI